MTSKDTRTPDDVSEEERDGNDVSSQEPEKEREIGGRDGPDPTRYGDWEKNGRCIDF